MLPANENHILDWLPAYVLDALSDEERHQVDEHVAACKECQVELQAYQGVVEALPLAVKQANPAPMLKEKLMRSINARQTAYHTMPSQGAQPKVNHQKKTNILGSFWPAFGLAIIILLVMGNILLWRQLSLVAQQSNTPMRMLTLENTQYSPGAIGTLVMDPGGKYGTLVVDNLAPLNAGQQYQVWLNKSENLTSGGVFSVNPDGYASIEVHAPLPLVAYDAIGISIEPAGGSPAPTGANVFHAILTK